MDTHEQLIEIIELNVRAFYSKAINDVFIGYHFRKILNSPSEINSISNELGSFESHIPKVVDFWATQLITDHSSKLNRVHVLKIHEYLGIRKGELGRWLTLFRATLEAYQPKTSAQEQFISLWKEKVDHFENVFNKKFFS